MLTNNYSSILLNNTKETSDNLTNFECYRLCANKEHLEQLARKTPQVVWGRRGTGKTTLFKAFTYYINDLKSVSNSLSVYIMMSDLIPTKEELLKIKDINAELPIYIFKKLLLTLTEKLIAHYNAFEHYLNKNEKDRFADIYISLDDSIRLGKEKIVEITKHERFEDENATAKAIALDISPSPSLIDTIKARFLFNKKNNSSQKTNVSKEIHFYIETTDIKEKLTELLNLLRIDCLFICLDEYSDIGKIPVYQIQSQLAQLIKQVFFKSSKFAVKIATIWNESKLATRNAQGPFGIEYKEDIFRKFPK